jgi:hypothetical protein
MRAELQSERVGGDGGWLGRRGSKDRSMLFEALLPLAFLSPYLLPLAAMLLQPAAVIPADDD